MKTNKPKTMYKSFCTQFFQSIGKALSPVFQDKRIALVVIVLLITSVDSFANNGDLGRSEIATRMPVLFRLVHLIVLGGIVIFAGKAALEGARGEQGAWQKFLGLVVVGALWTWGVPQLVTMMSTQTININ